MAEYQITSPANDRIKRLVRLRQRRHRDAEGVFLVEGERLVGRAMASGLSPVEAYTDGSVDIDLPGAITVEPSVLDKASYRKTSQGVIAVFDQLPTTLDRISPSRPALLMVAAGIEKPGNLGAILRTAASVGSDGLIIVDAATDIFNPNTVRASTGAIFNVPVAITDMASLRKWLSRGSISLIATASEAPTSLWQIDLSGDCALMVGAEHTGLSPTALAHADRVVAIPMHSRHVDSLNASVTAALIAYEALRQRS